MEREDATPPLSPSQLLHLAETHLRLRNFSLCRQYALESQQPNDPNCRRNHHHATQLVAVSDILSAASSSNPINWYSVLQIDSFSDDLALIRTNFNNLLRLLQDPVNGRLPLVGEALGLISKAFETLSIPPNKAQLDSQLAFLLSSQKHSNCDDEGEGSFWTFCPYCFYMYQYAGVYEGCCLRCQNQTCRRAFQGVSLSCLPRTELDKGQYFGCFGYFPLGFSPSEGEAKGKFESWSPIVGLFPVKRVGKAGDGRINVEDDHNNNAHCVEILDESDESEAGQRENENEHVRSSPRKVKKKTVAWNARKYMAKGGCNNEGANDLFGRSKDGNEDETYSFGDMHDTGMGSGYGLDADDVKIYEEDGEIFVGLGNDRAL